MEGKGRREEVGGRRKQGGGKSDAAGGKRDDEEGRKEEGGGRRDEACGMREDSLHREFIDYKTSMITDDDIPRELLFCEDFCVSPTTSSSRSEARNGSRPSVRLASARTSKTVCFAAASCASICHEIETGV